MITKNTDGTYTVGYIKCLSEEAALALLEDTGAHGLVDPLTVQAASEPRYVYAMRVVRDEVSKMPRAEVYTYDNFAA